MSDSDQGLGVLKKMKTDLNNQYQTKGSSKKGSKLSAYIPESVKEFYGNSIGNVSKKQWFDITLFAGGIFCMYKFGGVISEQIDEFMPNED